MKQYLILGSGTHLSKRIYLEPGSPEREFQGEITTVDYLGGDIKADLNELPYDWAADESFDEIHAYEILEHTGSQGDGEFFFGQFNEFHRILRPDGLMMISVPMWNHQGALGVPDHKRVMPLSVFLFLEERYYDNVGKPGYGDYRPFIKGYWKCEGAEEGEHTLMLALRCLKSS